MTTVLVVGNSDGERRCDARCHHARHPGCVCVCGGAYHGIGRTPNRDDILREHPEFRPMVEAAERERQGALAFAEGGA